MRTYIICVSYSKIAGLRIQTPPYITNSPLKMYLDDHRPMKKSLSESPVMDYLKYDEIV
jgi:hypothetical protein